MLAVLPIMWYLVSYACKGNESVTEELNSLKAIIAATKDDDGDIRDVKRLARRLLNESTKHRVVSKQEALGQLAGLPLYTCSEGFETVSLSGLSKLDTANTGNTTFLQKYAKRSAAFNHLSLHQYFHHVKNNSLQQGRRFKKTLIPIYSGARCEAEYPVTNEYARGVLLIHCPWRDSFPFKKNDEQLSKEFQTFIADLSRCPKAIRISFERAKLLATMKEPTSSHDIDYNNFTISPDEETSDLVDLASSIYATYSDEMDSIDYRYDYGQNFNWSERTFEVSTILSEFSHMWEIYDRTELVIQLNCLCSKNILCTYWSI